MKLQVSIEANIPIGCPEHDVHIPELAILKIVQIFQWSVVEYIVMLISVHKISDVKGPAHAEHVTHIPRVPKGKISRVISSKTASGYSHLGHTCIKSDPLDQFMTNHLVVGDMLLNSVVRMDFPV